jgi:hypothetical protein
MTTVVGVFGSSDKALGALEALRGTPLHADSIRLVGRPDDATELAGAGGSGVSVAAGPAEAVIGGLLESDLNPAELQEARQRIEGGGAIVLADELDQDTASTLAQHLRDHQAENVIIKGAPAAKSEG